MERAKREAAQRAVFLDGLARSYSVICERLKARQEEKEGKEDEEEGKEGKEEEEEGGGGGGRCGALWCGEGAARSPLVTQQKIY